MRPRPRASERFAKTGCSERRRPSTSSLFDGEAARAYGRVYAAVSDAGRAARGARAVDLLIAATACAAGLPLCTRNPDDFAGLDGIVDVIAV